MPSGAHRRRRTPHDILLDQLYLMDLKVRQVAEDVVKNGSQRLVTHGRFLADRYSSSELKVQDRAATAATAPQLVHYVGVIAGRGVLQDQLVPAIRSSSRLMTTLPTVSGTRPARSPAACRRASRQVDRLPRAALGGPKQASITAFTT